MNKLEFFKKLKRFSPIEHSISVVGFLFLILCLCCSLLYLDYGAGARRLMSRARVTWLGAAIGSLSRNGDVGFGEVGDGGGECDLFDGKWVWDETYPLYDSKDCMFLDAGFRCSENGRPDSFYTKWRWQPRTCNLPRFDAKMMLEKLRNRRLVFVGDSIGRNQWESLLCMLASVIPDKASVYEVNGSPITKHTGFLVFKFRDYNCTIEYYRAPFLVLQGRAPAGAPEFVKTTLKLDKMDWTASRWKDADLLIFNSGHWWNYEKTVRGGCYFQERNEVKMNMTVEHAFRLSVETLIRWIDEQVNTSKTHIFLRSYAPVHFRGGDWKTGGSCHMEKLPDLSSPFTLQMWPHFSIVNDVLFKHSNASRKVNLLNVTYMTSQRREGHSSLYYLGSKLAPLHRQDCSHWCLPGVPDAWNELLYAVFMKLESIRSQNSTRS